MKAATYKETVKAAHEGFHIRMFITVLFIMTKKKKKGRNLEVQPPGIE